MMPTAPSLAKLYGQDSITISAQTARYKLLLNRFYTTFPGQTSTRLFSAPGRAEIGGNHTDHQSGRVLAAAINLDTIAAAALNGTMTARVYSDSFDPIEVNLADLSVQGKSEWGTSEAIIRGCAARMVDLGKTVGGFDAAVTSNVFVGSGLSSSAAFEVLICTIFDGLFGNGDLSPVLRAQISQYAENEYFGKPSGLMDQTASSVGGIVAIDFEKEQPQINALSYDFAKKGYALAVVNTGGAHDDLTDAYAGIRTEMEQVAAFFGQERLRFVQPQAFEAAIPKLRGAVSDRAILRAFHFFDENERVPQMVAALQADDLPAFFRLIIASGQSSWMLLQNIWATPQSQPLALALELSRRMLEGNGAWRVHGGGFAGTILAFVPQDRMDMYTEKMNAVFGENACRPLSIRPVGACELTHRDEA